jgi:opacity protein-like surface antigen
MNPTNKWSGARAWLATVALAAISVLAALSAVAATQTQNLAYIDSLTVINGGKFPTQDAAFAGYNFFQLTLPNITAANLGPGGTCGTAACDTVLLNVASVGMGCNVSILTTAQQTDLLNFVNNGGKLIISDSECTSQDYNWLPYPFKTNNPGALGQVGTLTIVENNALSSNISSDPKYIDAGMLASDTDAIGDMNVMTTLDSNWCLDMSGTNANNVTGPVHTYARYGKGLLIYLGMDVDVLNYAGTTVPSSTSGDGNLAKIWLQELQVPFNPTSATALPCGATVVGVNISPLTAVTNVADTQFTITATLKDLLNNPEPGQTVTFTVLSGPNAGVSGICNPATCVSDSNGQVSFTYTGDGTEGIDEIQACFLDSSEQQRCSQIATNEWSTTVPPSGVVDFSGSGGGGSIGPLELVFGALCLPLIWLQHTKRMFKASDLVTALLCILIVSVSLTASAAGGPMGYYVGASVGSANSTASASDYDAALAGMGYTASSSIDDNNTGWKLFGGYSFTPNWAVEGSYVDFGEVDSHTTVSSPALPTSVEQQQFVDKAATVHPYSVDGFALAAKGTLPINPQFSLFAKLGIFFWNADIKVNCNGCASTVSTKKSDSGTDWTGGVGMGYDFNANFGLRLEYERYATNRDDVDFYSAGLEYRF